jgi:hypothetical protein
MSEAHWPLCNKLFSLKQNYPAWIASSRNKWMIQYSLDQTFTFWIKTFNFNFIVYKRIQLFYPDQITLENSIRGSNNLWNILVTYSILVERIFQWNKIIPLFSNNPLPPGDTTRTRRIVYSMYIIDHPGYEQCCW